MQSNDRLNTGPEDLKQERLTRVFIQTAQRAARGQPLNRKERRALASGGSEAMYKVRKGAR